MNKKRVLVAMSGGVDSSVAAAILKQDGYEVIGATMKIWPKEYCGKQHKKACCSLNDIEDAQKVCSKLGIKHYVLNFEKVFREEVIDYFASEYISGRTPNPCIICNERVKFGKLLEKAKELDCDFVATGHYARIERNGNGSCKLRQGLDESKDQSYVLFSLKKEQIAKSLFPIGGFKKSRVRETAKEFGLKLHEKPDSQEICFIPEGNYSNFLKESCNVKPKKGDVLDSDGKKLGTHNGFWNFTIGQRKGLGISSSKPLYIIKIDPEKNIIVVGESSQVNKKKFLVKGLNWLCKEGGREIERDVKIRYVHQKAKAKIKRIADDTVEVEFLKGQEAITPGQAAVFYDGDIVIGGGWIEKVLG